eukprot:TRINITY_DN6150_c0_g1_i5.p1 TRINITY_DN6150_c0_g1~~TRINITY_DN6150_c0_g1_i5.p1  ORF type:complete len:260 (+),score=57.16 TRINITY_DN6150_c0_g1_i5:311-1090(+)
MELSFAERAALARNPTAKNLFEIMELKATNLCVSVDVTTKEKLLWIANQVGPFICMLKTHVDILEDYDSELTAALSKIASTHNFLLFEDRKFADIGNTLKYQYGGGIYKIVQWADMVNCHLVGGSTSVASLREVGLPFGRGLLVLAEMSTVDTRTGKDTISASLSIASTYPDFVVGFISQGRIASDSPHLLHCTPGVNLSTTSDGKGQNYNTPDVVVKRGTDVVIVGRGIIEAPDVVEAAKMYRDCSWKAYLERLHGKK